VYIDTESLLERHNESTRQSSTPSSGSLDRSAANTVGHDADEEEGGGDGHALKVLGLARLVLGDQSDGGVEAGETSNSGADEDGEEGGVGGGAKADAEGAHGGGDTEGDLLCCMTVSLLSVSGEGRAHRIGERVELLSEHGRLVPPAGDLAIESVEDHSSERESKSLPVGLSKSQLFASFTVKRLLAHQRYLGSEVRR
jgi:hypothetical protein